MMQLHLYYVKMENVGYNMNTPNLKMILETLMDDQPKPMSKDEKLAVMQEIKNFSALGESVYGKGDLEHIVERVRNIVESAQRVMTEKSDWFDQVSLKREGKRLQEDYKVFEDACKEMKVLQERMAMAYENIGQNLNRYFEM
jgi:hypothetical protein